MLDRSRPPTSPPWSLPLQVSVEHPGPVGIVRAAGEVDAFTVDCLARTVHRELTAAPPALVLDLLQVTFFAAAGARLLLQSRYTALTVDTDLRLVSGEPVVRLLKVTGLDAEFTVHATVEEALTVLSAR